jgi:hypothetical protein
MNNETNGHNLESPHPIYDGSPDLTAAQDAGYLATSNFFEKDNKPTEADVLGEDQAWGQ